MSVDADSQRNGTWTEVLIQCVTFGMNVFVIIANEQENNELANTHTIALFYSKWW